MKNFTREREAHSENSGLKYLKWCLVFLCLISLNLSTNTLSAQNVAVFLDQDFGSGENQPNDPDVNTCADEDSNLEELLDDFLSDGEFSSLTKITDVSTFNFVSGLANIDVLILPEQEFEPNVFDHRVALFAALGSANIEAIQDWVSDGGIFINIFTESMINALFYDGQTVISGVGANNNVDVFSINQPDVDEALFNQCGLEPSLTANNNTLVLTSTLPQGSYCFYKNGNTSPAVQIPYGFGCIRFFGWDLFNAWDDCEGGLNNSPADDGIQFSPDWNDLLICMMTTTKPEEPEECVLPCNNNVQVSLDGNCHAYILPDMILEDPTLGCTYLVEILDEYDNVIPSNPIVTVDHIGLTLKVRVINPDGNFCWGYIHVEDKLGPAIECLDDITVSCNDWFNTLDFSDKTLTAEFSGQTTTPEDANLVGDAAEILMNMDNTTNQILFAESGSLSIDLEYSVPGGNQDIEIWLYAPDGNPTYSDVVTTNSTTINIDLTASLEGMQTYDDYFDGDWALFVGDRTVDGRVVSVVGVDMSVDAIGPATDNCTDFVYETLDIDEDDHDCTFDDYSYKKIFKYQAVDSHGNESAECFLHIYFERRTLDDLEFPDDVVFDCGETAVADWDKNNNDYPDASDDEAGVPTIDGNPIFPNDHYCEINVTFEDQLIDICDGQYKVLRRWTALDWCQPEELEEEYQIIKVGNFSGRIITSCPQDDMQFPADPYYCQTNALVDPPIVDLDEYCATLSYTVAYLLADDDGQPDPSGVYTPTGVSYAMNEKALVPGLPLGRTWIKYTVTDACGNIGECFTEVDVYDDIPPYPVCDQFTTVTLTQSGWAKIYSESFDDGSHDNCTDVSFAVRRMNQVCGNNSDLVYVRSYNGNDYYEFEHFCCSDVGEEDIMVELLVCDEFDNCNSCMVVVEVEDKIDFFIQCPPNVIIDCETDPNATDSDGKFLTGEPNPVIDNCGEAVITHEDILVSIDNCGVGFITREWTATIGSQSKVCVQTITVENLTPNNSIQGPANDEVNIEGCMSLDTDPSNPNIGGPTWNDDFCSLISSTYDDQTFYFADGACFKIVREWTVIDWCLFDATGGQSGLYYFNQVIKVNNYEEPDFGNTCADKNVLAYGDNCDEYVEVIVIAEDDCTQPNELVYSYELNLFSDISNDIDDTGNDNDASRVFPVGTHTIYWEVEDMCGNTETCTQVINVVDDKNPTPYCLGGVTTVVMNDPDNSEVRIWASDFDLGSADKCDGTNVYISFSPDINDIYREYGCDELGVQVVEIWVTDQSGNQDYCTTMIDVQDNMGICPDGGDGNGDVSSDVSGRIMSESQASVENVNVRLYNMDDNNSSELNTVTDGSFAFGELTNGMDYQLTAERNDNYLNGVSTLDLVLIQKHILGLGSLDSPYKVIAADANNNETVSATDLIELRKLILGIYSELPSNDSWRFIDASQQFPLASMPWPLQEVISLNNLSSDMLENNFVAVKVGDVNGNASTSMTSSPITENRAQAYYFNANNQSYKAGDLVEMVVKASEAISATGYQFTIDYDSSLEYLAYVNGDAIDTDENNIHVNEDMNMITTSWSSGYAKEIAQNHTLFTLQFRAKTNNSIANSVEFNSKLIDAEIYNEDLDLRSVGITYDGIVVNEKTLIVSQNRPNPFDEMTQIEFRIASDSDVTLKVIDLTGKMVYQTTNFYTAGQNTITLYSNELGFKGMMYYQISTDTETVTRKMLIVE